MRKIILTGAVLAMLTSAAPMVHAQIDPDVQQALDKKVNQDKYDAEIKDLKEKAGKVDSFDGKITNIQKGLDSYRDENDKKVNKKVDEDKFEEKLNTQKQSILGDVDNKITQAKKDLKADAETKFEAQRKSSLLIKGIAEKNQKLLVGDDGNGGLKKVVGENENEGLQKAVKENKKLLVGDNGNGGLQKDVENNKKLLVGDDGNGGLKGDIKKLQDAVGDNNSGLQKEVNTIKATAEAQRNVLTELNKVVGKDENEGLRKAVKENANNITQADNKAESAKAESAAASRLALEVKGKAETADQKATQALTDVAELKAKGNDMAKDIAELGGRINVTGAMSAALAGLKPLQYDPMAPTQVMGSVSTYEGQQAYALGLAHFTSEDLMVHGGVSFTNSHKYMANVGVTYKFGHSAEKSMIPMRYQAGPISSIYVMQKENEMMREKMAQQEERIAQLEEMIMNMKK